jgi:hypothetical protein
MLRRVAFILALAAAVPVGELEVRVGTREELAAGGASHRQHLAVDRAGVPFLDVLVGR